jgi:hypothetical protein
MQSNQPKKRKNDFTGAKIIIGALSLAGTFGLWNVFANKPVQASNQPQDPGKNTQQDGNTVVMQLPAMPTLVPIRDPNIAQGQPQLAVNMQTNSLRQVTQPTPVPVQVNNKPVFQVLTVNRPGNSGSGSSGSSR